jgi:tetratricopeptide (TPR) repeat protein
MSIFRRQSVAVILAAGWCLLFLSCVTVRTGENVDDYAATIKRLLGQLLKNPNDAEASRDLGVIYFQTGRYQDAATQLKKVTTVNPNDAKAQFYYGMSLEYLNSRSQALAAYLKYTEASSLSPYRKLMEGRYRQLTRDIIQEQFQNLLTQEAMLTNDRMAAKTVAVFPLEYQGKDEKFSALGKGLSELMISDLGQVKGLTLVERIRIEALQKELQFGASKYVDQSTAPRLGRLLGAARMVAGSYTVAGNDRLRVDVASWDVPNKTFPEPTSQSDVLDNLFRIEKDIVFGVIKQLGITLTPAEREKIAQMPTRNLQAFLAYSIGLERQDQGDFRGAATYFREAATLDPNFGPAKSKVDETEALASAGGPKETALASARRIDPPPPPDVASMRENLLQSRFQRVGENIGSSFVPGQENRKPAEQAAAAGAAVGDLPKPPPPPNR